MRYLFIFLSLILFYSCNNYEGIDINKPSAYISYPDNGDFISDTLIVSAIASDDIGIHYLELWINQENTNKKDYEPPYEFIVDTRSLIDIEEGSSLELSVKAFDTSENESSLSTPIQIIIDNEKPTSVILNPIIDENGLLQFSWSQCRDLDFYAYVIMMNNVHFSFIDTIYSSNDIQRTISYNSNSAEFFKINVIDKGFKESGSNSVQPVSFEFITVEPGVFKFGPNDVSKTVEAQFQLMSTEVTNLQYRSYLSVAKELNQIDTMNIGPWVKDNDGNILYDLENGYVKWDGSSFYIDGIINNHHIPYYPVNFVSWIGATHFAEFFNFRLPSEIEWEKASGGNGEFDYPWGFAFDENNNPINEINSSNANYANNEDVNNQIEPYEPGNGINQLNEPGLAPVSLYQDDVSPFWFFNTCPNECYGFNHMAGNVWEWVTHENGYPSNRMSRGGSWKSTKQDLRIWSTKSLMSHNTLGDIGFRCAK